MTAVPPGALHYDNATDRFVLNGVAVCGWCLKPSGSRYCDSDCRHHASLERRRLHYRLKALGPITAMAKPTLTSPSSAVGEPDLLAVGGAR